VELSIAVKVKMPRAGSQIAEGGGVLALYLPT